MRWNPNRYSQTSMRRIDLFKGLLQWAGIHDLNNKHILDIGCGDGSIDNLIVSTWKNINLLAIDSDDNMIAYTRENYVYENLDFQVMRAEAITVSNQFDIILSMSCLHWVKDQHRVLSSVYSLLEKDGVALFLICTEQPYIWEVLSEIIKQPFWEPYFQDFHPGYYFYDEDNYRIMAEKAGFQVEKIELLHENLGIDKQENIESLIAGWLPHLDKIPDELHSRFLREVSNNALSKMKQDGLNGFKDYEGSALNVLLKK